MATTEATTSTRRRPNLGRRRSRAALAAVASAVALALAGCTTSDGDGASPSPTTASPTSTASPTETAAPGVTSLVYFVIDTRTGLRLAREPRTLDADDPGRAAVGAMIAGPEDPDYISTWNPATQVLSVSRESEAITVDLSEEARTANVGSPGAAAMIGQLVWTVSEAIDAEAPVQLLIEGEPAGELWGVVSWDEPISRDDPLNARLLVQIDSPAEGAQVTSPVTISGDAAAFEANVPWRVLDSSGAEVQTGFTMTSEGQTFAPFSFTVELEPGTYTVEISEDDPSDGAGGTPMADTRTITVS